MQFITLLPSALLLLPLVSASPVLRRHPGHDHGFTFKPVDASGDFPIVKTMGPTIEGVSIDNQGAHHAVNKTSLINLVTGKAVHTNLAEKLQFSSSRGLKNGDFLLGDAVGHTVYTISGGNAKPRFVSDQWKQPNDMAMSADESRFYFSGMNYMEGTGDVWFGDRNNKLTQIPFGDAKIGRTNGIELSKDGCTLYVTSAENTVSGTDDAPIIKVTGAKVFSIALDKASGLPAKGAKWTQVIDLYAEAGEEAKKAEADPDGMRLDSEGWMYSTLNAHGRVLRWNTKNPKENEVIKLATVAFPTNLEMGGKDGKLLVVVGGCAKKDEKDPNEVRQACVDKMEVPYEGRAWAALTGKSSGCKPKRN